MTMYHDRNPLQLYISTFISLTAEMFKSQCWALSCMPETSVHLRFPPTHLSGQTCMSTGLSRMKACNKQACKMDAQVGSNDQACLSTASWLLMWAAVITVPLRSSGKQTAITSTLQVANEHFTSSVETERAKSLQAVVIACLVFMSLMTEALISKVLKRLQQQGLC